MRLLAKLCRTVATVGSSLAALLGGCFSDTGDTDWGSGSGSVSGVSSSSKETDTGLSGTDAGSAPTDSGQTSNETTYEGASTTSSQTTTPSDQSSTSETTTETTMGHSTTGMVTTTGGGSSWYASCYSDADCWDGLFCYTSVIGKGHCTDDCACIVPGDCGQNTCPQPTSGTVAPWCYSDFCWLFRAAIPCLALECPDDLVCHEVYDGGDKAICAAP
jgi:hypothetical protein